jgi:hypothetical protein
MQPQDLNEFLRNFQTIFGASMVGFGVLMTICTGLPFIAIAAFLFYSSRRARQQADNSLTWPSVIGSVVSSAVETRRSTDSDGHTSTSHYPRITYEYDVQGHRYRSDRFAFGGLVSSGGYAGAQAVVDRYVPGNQIRVYYNPQQPSEAVLERAAPTSKVLNWVAVFILVILGVTMCSVLAATILPVVLLNNLIK